MERANRIELKTAKQLGRPLAVATTLIVYSNLGAALAYAQKWNAE